MPSTISSNPLPTLDTVAPLSPDDDRCFEELRQVLVKHGREKRFGVTLLHQHFQVADDEILVEENDPEARTLVIRPEKSSEFVNKDFRPTSWRLDSGRAEMNCVCPEVKGTHLGKHIPVGR